MCYPTHYYYILTHFIIGEQWKHGLHGYKTPAMCTPVSAISYLDHNSAEKQWDNALSPISVQSQRERERELWNSIIMPWADTSVNWGTDQTTSHYDICLIQYFKPYNDDIAEQMHDRCQSLIQVSRVPNLVETGRSEIFNCQNETECSECQAKLKKTQPLDMDC